MPVLGFLSYIAFIQECAIGDEELIEMAEIVEKGESADDQSNSTSGQGLDHKERLCAGHERAIPIEELVAKLDMKEEGKQLHSS